jgi:integrase
MAKRRPSGDGMVRKREDGRWEGRIVVGHKKNGTPIFQHAYAHTQKELTEKLHQNIERYQDVELTEDSRMTLGEWLDRWLTDYKENTVRPGTFAGYRSCIENYIKPQLGGKQVSLVTAQDVQKLYRKLKENGRIKEHPRFGSALSDTTINRLHAIFHQAMEDAFHAHIIAKNPTVGATVPKASHAPKRVLTDKELDTFLDAVREDKIWGDFFYVELTTGLRRGEICALRWEDFDTKQETLHVRRTLHKEKGKPLTTGDTKTYAGTRKIVLPPSTAQLLRERKKTAPTEWIFPNPFDPEQPIAPGTAYNRLKALLKETGLPDIRFHDLRHTFATHAIASGVDAKTLSGILGHTNASFTLDTYTHVTPDMQKAASGIVGGFMEDLLGKGLRPWQRNGKAELAP